MKNYRGYYIDGICFNSKADIDNFIKAQNIKSMQIANEMMLRSTGDTAMAHSIRAQKYAEYLHDHCGMSWSEIEAVEFAS